MATKQTASPVKQIIPAKALTVVVSGKPASNSIFSVDPRALTVDPAFNALDRFDSKNDAVDAEHKASIRENGILEPILVRFDGAICYIVRGHRRHGAVMELIAEGADIKSIPARLEARGVTPAERTLDVLTSNTGKPLTQMQRGEIAMRLRAFGWSDAEVAKKAGVTPRHIVDCVTLAKADPRVRAAVKARMLSETAAIQLVSQAGRDAPAIVEKAITMAPTTGARAGRVTAPVIAAATAHVAAGRAAPIVGASGQETTNRKAIIKPVPPVAPAPAPAKKPASTKEATGAMARLVGPFRPMDDGTVCDGSGAGIAGADSPAIARSIVALLNFAWSHMSPAAKHEAGVASGAPTATPEPATVPAPAPVKPTAPGVVKRGKAWKAAKAA